MLRVSRSGIVPVVLAAGVVAGLLRGETAPVPSLTSATLAPVPVVAAIALVPAVAVLWSWSGLPWQMYADSARRISTPMVAHCCTIPLAYAAASATTGGSGAFLENVRNAAGLTGLVLIGAWWRGERAAMALPIGYLLASFMLGRSGGSPSASAWAWVLTDAGTLSSMLIALAAMILGTALVPALPARMLVTAE